MAVVNADDTDVKITRSAVVNIAKLGISRIVLKEVNVMLITHRTANNLR